MSGAFRQLRASVAIAALACLLPIASVAQFYDPDEPQLQLEPTPQLSENLSYIVRPRADATMPKIERLSDIALALGTCWRVPGGDTPSEREITLRVAFRRNGQVIGSPKVTYRRLLPGDSTKQEEFARSVSEAFERCKPLPFTEKLGGAVAGRIFTFRFSDTRPM